MSDKEEPLLDLPTDAELAATLEAGADKATLEANFNNALVKSLEAADAEAKLLAIDQSGCYREPALHPELQLHDRQPPSTYPKIVGLTSGGSDEHTDSCGCDKWLR